MCYETDPYDVMRYHSQMIELFRPYISDLSINNNLIRQLEETGKVINRFFRDGVIDYTTPVVNTVIMGKAIESINNLPVIKPDGTRWQRSAKEIYAKRLLTAENPWETIYELEVANFCFSTGFSTKLVHEGQDAGPDIFVYNDGERIDIECKRRQPYPHNRETNYEEIRKQIVSQLNIGDDSFFIELSADGPLKGSAIDSVIDLAIDVINNRKPEAVEKIGGTKYKINLKDYYQGKRSLDLSKQDVERWFRHDVLPRPAIYAFLSPFDAGEISPGSHINMNIMFTEEGTTITKNGTVFDFNFPTIDERLYDRIVSNTLESGRSDLKGRSPSVLFIYLPAYDVEDLSRYYVQEGSYAPTPQIQRLEQRVRGELKQSTSVNAVVINTTYFEANDNNCRVKRGYKLFRNQSPENQLPNQFAQYLNKGLSAE